MQRIAKYLSLSVVAVLIGVFETSVSAQNSDKWAFTIEVNQGMSFMYSHTGLSPINYKNTNSFSIMEQASLGLVRRSIGGLYFDIGGVYSNVMRYNNDLSEEIRLTNVGLSISNVVGLSDHTYIDARAGVGLTFLDNKVYYLDNEYEIDNKMGSYFKLSLSPMYKISNFMECGFRFENFLGRTKDKDYPQELNNYLRKTDFNFWGSASVSIVIKAVF